MTSDGASVVEYEVRIAARPETVFGYFTDPAKMPLWMGIQATLDPRPGGVCRLEFAGGLVVLGQFVEVDPHRRIIFTWGWEEEALQVPPQSTEVEVSFTPDGGSTLVRLAHRNLPPHALTFHRAGWDHYLGRLAVGAAGGDPGEDPWRDRAVALRAVRRYAAGRS